MNFLNKYGLLISLILIVLLSLSTCGQGKKISTLTKQVDSLQKTQVSADQLREIIKTTPAYQTLILEELSDKNHVPINQLRIENEKK